MPPAAPRLCARSLRCYPVPGAGPAQDLHRSASCLLGSHLREEFEWMVGELFRRDWLESPRDRTSRRSRPECRLGADEGCRAPNRSMQAVDRPTGGRRRSSELRWSPPPRGTAWIGRHLRNTVRLQRPCSPRGSTNGYRRGRWKGALHPRREGPPLRAMPGLPTPDGARPVGAWLVVSLRD